MPSKRFELVFADKTGKVFNFPGLRPAGMKAGMLFELEDAPLVRLPDSSELFMLPDRMPVGFDPETGKQVTLDMDPYSKQAEPCFAVAAFVPPGYTLTHNAAYRQLADDARALPLFAYGACLYSEGHFYVAAVRVDHDVRHDDKYLAPRSVLKGVAEVKKLFPKNRLVTQLETCATVNGCANAKNFFLGRIEAPVPTSPVCNAQCQGCISLQPENRDFPSTQKRISFKPDPEEIAELALHHFTNEKNPVVSFGQGCEGEPTLAVDVIEKAIRLIRKQTSKGFINVNSNASRPQALGRLFDAGLTHVRVSLNSVRDPYYSRYYQPKGYSFADVTESVRTAKRHQGFVSLNYLSMPGFTDSREESDALVQFVGGTGVDMIQWRNLNYDPIRYFRELGLEGARPELLGMENAIDRVRKAFPAMRCGYFNPRPGTRPASQANKNLV
jgi:pyruvate-formate lyase-activating enzyme